MDWERISRELSKKLDPKYVKDPPKGKYGEYIEGHHVIREANRIFGFEGWSDEVVSLQLTNATQSGEMHHVGYIATVSVVVDRTRHVGVGHGQGHGRSEGDAHDSAVKEAETDAIKRALRKFGDPFGLALYDKTKANVGVERDPKAVADSLIDVMDKAKTRPDFEKATGGEKFKAARQWLVDEHPDHAKRVDAAYDMAKATRAEPTPDELLGA